MYVKKGCSKMPLQCFEGLVRYYEEAVNDWQMGFGIKIDCYGEKQGDGAEEGK